MPKISDKRYVEFIKTGLITPISTPEFEKMLEKVKHKYLKQARAIVILAFYSGRRPAEILDLPGGNIRTKGRHIEIMFPTLKGGKYSLMYYPKTEHMKEVIEYASSLYPGQYFGWGFRNKPGSLKKKVIAYTKNNGRISLKEYERTNTRLRYYFKKWFGITPYFFRHNRFSDMALKGATMLEIKHAKGAKDLKSVEPYTHLSVEKAKKISKYFK